MSNDEVQAGKMSDGTVVWRLPNGNWHREDGPAVLYPDGRESWYMNDLPHRIGGPAIVSEEGAKQWFINGQLHRTDGPAYEFASGANDKSENLFRRNFGLYEWKITKVL